MSISTQTPPRSCTSNAGDVRNRKEEKFDPKIHKDKVKTTRNKKKQLEEGQHYSIHAPLHTSTHTHTHTHTSCATSSDWIHRLRRPLLSYPYMCYVCMYSIDEGTEKWISNKLFPKKKIQLDPSQKKSSAESNRIESTDSIE